MAAAAAIGGIVGGGVTGGAGIGEAALQNLWSRANTHSARRWAEKMRSTQYQTAVEDLRKAGLNPMLAYTQGGAGTPNVSAASTPNVDFGDLSGSIQRGVSTAKQARIQDAEVSIAQANKRAAEAGATTAEAKSRYSVEQAAADVQDTWNRATATGFSASLTNMQAQRQQLENRLRGYDEQELRMRVQWLKDHPTLYNLQQLSGAVQGGVSSASQVRGMFK